MKVRGVEAGERAVHTLQGVNEEERQRVRVYARVMPYLEIKNNALQDSGDPRK